MKVVLVFDIEEMDDKTVPSKMAGIVKKWVEAKFEAEDYYSQLHNTNVDFDALRKAEEAEDYDYCDANPAVVTVRLHFDESHIATNKLDINADGNVTQQIFD